MLLSSLGVREPVFMDTTNDDPRSRQQRAENYHVRRHGARHEAVHTPPLFRPMLRRDLIALRLRWDG